MTDYVQLTRNEIDRATNGITLAELTRHPAGKWCAAEVLEHLGLAFSGTARSLERALEMGRPAATPKSFSQKIFTVVVVGLGHLPHGRPAPAMVIPGKIAPEEALSWTCRNLEEMGVVLTRCAEKFGLSVKLNDHPILGAFNIEQWRKFHYVHTRHHMRQIRKLRSQA